MPTYDFAIPYAIPYAIFSSHYINRYASHSCQPLHQLLCQPLLPATASIAMPPTPASHSINCYASHSCQPLHQLLCQPLLPATRPLTTTATRRNICANQRSRKVDIADDIFVSEMSSLCQRCHLNHEGWMFQ